MKTKDFPPILYKYRDWTTETHRDVLLKNQLFFSSPKDFNDPFDCRISKNYLLLNTKEKVRKFVDKLVIKHFDTLVKRGQNIETIINNMTDRFINHREIEQKTYEKSHFDSQDKFYGVLSLSELWDNILMWSHYSNKHKGYCVGFHEKQLRSQANIQKFKAGPVMYLRTFPKIDPMSDENIKNGFIETHVKAINWKYEREYRLFKFFWPDLPTTNDRIFNVEDKSFAEILIGKDFPETEIEGMAKIADSKKVPLYQVDKVPYKFRLTRKRLT